MTDTTRYTGSHKERFDETGKGRGIEGREGRVANTGYVGAYKHEGTYGASPKHARKRVCRFLKKAVKVKAVLCTLSTGPLF